MRHVLDSQKTFQIDNSFVMLMSTLKMLMIPECYIEFSYTHFQRPFDKDIMTLGNEHFTEGRLT